MAARVERGEGLNTVKCCFSDFLDDLRGKLSLLTGLCDMGSVGLKLEDVRRPMLVVALPGIGKTEAILSLREELNSRLPFDRQLGFKKILLGQTVVGSLSGIPVVKTGWDRIKGPFAGSADGGERRKIWDTLS